MFASQHNYPNLAPEPTVITYGRPKFRPWDTTSGILTSSFAGLTQGTSNSSAPTSARQASPLTAISEGLRLFNDPEYSDLELRCEDRTWKVHRVIVCGRCQFFKACVDRHFKGQEASKGVIDLRDDNSDAVEALLKYLYTYDIETCLEDLPEDRKGTDDFAILMFTAADKYMLPELKQHWCGVLEKSAKMSDWIKPPSISGVVTFEGDKIAEFLSLIYSCDAPGIENIREKAIDALCSTVFFHSHVVKDEAMIAVFQEHEDLRMGFLFSLLPKDQAQKPMLEMLKHESVYSTVAKNAAIGIELIQNLIESRRTVGQHARFR